MPRQTRGMANGTSRPNPPNLSASAASGRRKERTKVTTGNQFTEPTPFPKFQFADNAKSLSDIRNALGSHRLSQLPTLDQLSFAPIKPDRSFDWLPLSLHIGYYISTNKESPYGLLPIHANVNGATRGNPYLHIDAVAEESLGHIVSNDFKVAGNVDWKNFFQDWEVFAEHVHFLPCFVTMNSWNELLAQACYCFLLAWEAKLPKIFWEGIPTRTDMVAILTSMCTDVAQPGMEDANNRIERPSPNVAFAQGPHLVGSGGTQFGPYSETSAVDPGFQMKGIKRRLPDPSIPEPKRHAVEPEMSADHEGEELMMNQPSPMVESPENPLPKTAGDVDGTLSGLYTQPSPVRKVNSFKLMYRQPDGERSKTPPSPDYEPLSPGVATSAQFGRKTLSTPDINQHTDAVDDTGVVKIEPHTQMDSKLTSTEDQVHRRRVSLEDYTALQKAKNAHEPSNGHQSSGIESRTQHRPEHPPLIAEPSSSSVVQASTEITALASPFTEIKLQLKRDWAAILSRSIIERSARIREMERKFGDDRDLMQLIESSRGRFDLYYKKLEAEVKKMQGEIGKMREKVQKWIEDKDRVNEQLEGAKELEVETEAEK